MIRMKYKNIGVMYRDLYKLTKKSKDHGVPVLKKEDFVYEKNEETYFTSGCIWGVSARCLFGSARQSDIFIRKCHGRNIRNN